MAHCRCDSVNDLEMGSYSGLSEWAQCHHKGPSVKEEAGGSESEKEIDDRSRGQSHGIRGFEGGKGP